MVKFSGVCHADELLVMFSNNLLPPLVDADDIKVSKMLVDLWTSFSSKGSVHYLFK
jgi:Carboxylesterase family